MSRSRRLAILLFTFGFVLILVVVFWRFVAAAILFPIATVLWLVLRLLVLSVDQRTYWQGAIIVAALAALLRVVHIARKSASRSLLPQEARPENATATSERVSAWRESILSNRTPRSGANPARASMDATKRDLSWLVARLYSERRAGSAPLYQIRDALQKGAIPLPPSVHAFLFASAAPLPAARNHRRPPRQNEATSYLRWIEEVLTYMETSREIRT